MSKRILKINARFNELEAIYKGHFSPCPLEDTLVFGKMPPVSFVCAQESRHALDVVCCQTMPHFGYLKALKSSLL